jgi:hypothetical protein
MWFNRAAAGGDEDIAREGRENHDKLAGTMTPEQIARAQELAREWKPTKPSLSVARIARFNISP